VSSLTYFLESLKKSEKTKNTSCVASQNAIRAAPLCDWWQSRSSSACGHSSRPSRDRLVYTFGGNIWHGGRVEYGALFGRLFHRRRSALLSSIAAVIIGGVSMFGGEGSVGGTLIGALIIAVMTTGLVMLNVQPFWQYIVVGVVVILAVLIDQARDLVIGKMEAG
jgi:hypothetical protein